MRPLVSQKAHDRFVCHSWLCLCFRSQSLGVKMDQTCLHSLTSHVIVLVLASIALLHARQRRVPLLVLKFRALMFAHSCLNIGWTVTKAHLLQDGVHPGTTIGVATMTFTSRACLWIELLYFLENVAAVLIKISDGAPLQYNQSFHVHVLECL